MQLHVFPPSPRAIKVMALVRHLGLDCELTIVDLFKGEQMAPAFTALNLNHKMPVLDDDGFVLWESNAILQYLASKRPDSGMWPTDPQRRADVSRWQFWESAHWDPACALLVFERVVKQLAGQGEPDPQQEAKGEQDFQRYAAVLNQSLAGREWITGKDLTVADFSLGAAMVYSAQARFKLAEFPEIVRWYGGLSALPGWKAVLPPS